MNILDDFENKLLRRREMKLSISALSNPGLATVVKEISEKVGADESQIVVKKLASHFGKKDFIVEAFVYETEEVKNKTEPRKKEKKGRK